MTPRDAATLILVDRRTTTPKILMGRRSQAHAFLPGKYVFPGGRLDAGDARMAAATELPPETLARLCIRTPSPTRARALALAAIRETFEETGFILGQAATPAAVARRVLLLPPPAPCRQIGRISPKPATCQTWKNSPFSPAPSPHRADRAASIPASFWPMPLA